jgi:DNA-binding transcriptional LysR family regulator
MATIEEKTAGLVAFVRAVETGSFSAAGRVIGTTASAISKSVARLERRLGATLFRRSTRNLALTVEGTAFYERVAPLLRGLEQAEDAVHAGEGARGLLRISMPSELGRLLLHSLTSEFCARHPDIKLDLGMSDRHVDLIREGYDLALRAGHVGETNLVARSLKALPMVLVASPDHLRRMGTPRSLAELQKARHVRYMQRGRPFPVSFADGTTLALDDGALDVDAGFALRVAALDGVGIAQLMRCVVEEDLQAGRLAVVLPQLPLATVPMRILHAFGRTPPLRARLFSDFVAKRVAALAKPA